MASGKVKFFNSEKGFGFIVPDDGGSDVFLHKTALRKAGLEALEPGQAISFDLIEDQKNSKMKAENLALISNQ